MGKNKNIQASTSGIEEGEAMTNLRTLNAKLVKEAEELREEIQHLHHQIAAAAKRLESTVSELNELEMKLLVADEERNEVQRELDRILSDFSQRKDESEKAWKKKWIFPTALTAVFLASTFALGAFWSKRN